MLRDGPGHCNGAFLVDGFKNPRSAHIAFADQAERIQALGATPGILLSVYWYYTMYHIKVLHSVGRDQACEQRSDCRQTALLSAHNASLMDTELTWRSRGEPGVLVRPSIRDVQVSIESVIAFGKGPPL